MAEDVEAAESLAQHRQSEPNGRLRVTMPATWRSRDPAYARDFRAPTIPDPAGDRLVRAIRGPDRRRISTLPSAWALARRRDDGRAADRPLLGSLYAVARLPGAARHASEPEALMEHDALRTFSVPASRCMGAHHGEPRWEGVPPGRATANSPELLMRMALRARASDSERSLRTSHT